MLNLYPGDLFDGHYRLLDALSTDGGTADVWLAIDLNTVDVSPYDDDALSERTPSEIEQTGLKVAIKIYRPKNALDIEGEQRFREEFKIVFNCHHGNLIQPTHYDIWQGTPYLVLPFCAHGSTELLVGNLTGDHIWKYIEDVAAGLAYLHARRPPIVHQDIKPANVLVTDDFDYAITDFGISSELGHRDLFDFSSGTLAYMAPERFVEDNVPQPASDIYSFGATLYELITGHIPYGENGGSSQPDGRVMLNYGDRPVAADVKRLIAACLDKDPAQRPTADLIVQAARARTFPLHTKRNRAIKWGMASLAAVVLAAGIGLLAWHKGKHSAADGAGQEASANPQVLLDQAIAAARSDRPADIEQAFRQIDTIAQSYHFVPAYYEIARTYGMVFVQDSARYNRLKRALGVELGNINARNTLAKLKASAGDIGDFDRDIPKSIEHNTKANNACLTILSINDPAYARQMLDAAWMLGCYNMFCTNDKAEAVKYFRLAKQHAITVGDKSTASLADNYIQVIEHYL